MSSNQLNHLGLRITQLWMPFFRSWISVKGLYLWHVNQFLILNLLCVSPWFSNRVLRSPDAHRNHVGTLRSAVCFGAIPESIRQHTNHKLEAVPCFSIRLSYILFNDITSLQSWVWSDFSDNKQVLCENQRGTGSEGDCINQIWDLRSCLVPNRFTCPVSCSYLRMKYKLFILIIKSLHITT